MDTVTPEDETAPVYAQNWRKGIPNLLRWLSNPVSEGGAEALSRFERAVGGPALAKSLAQMRLDPVGSRVLADRPDLGAALGDMAALAAMREGSVGRAYHEFMDRPEVIPTAVLASLMYRDGELDSLDWDEDMIYVTERMGVTHDLTHIFSGYGTSLPAEAINIGFVIGFDGAPGGRIIVEVFAAITAALFLPSIGTQRWRSLVLEAFERGASAARHRPLGFLYIEELLPRPLDEVRQELGIPPMRQPVDAPESWIRNPIGRAMAHGYGKASKETADPLADAIVQLARRGMSARTIGTLSDEQADALKAVAERGGTIDELWAAVA